MKVSRYVIGLVAVALSCTQVEFEQFVSELAPTEAVEITFFDVGQGDAVLVSLPDGTRLLVARCSRLASRPLVTSTGGGWQKPRQSYAHTLHHRGKGLLKTEVHLRCPADDASFVVNEFVFIARFRGRLRKEHVRG